MSRGFPVLDDNERSPAWERHRPAAAPCFTSSRSGSSRSGAGSSRSTATMTDGLSSQRPAGAGSAVSRGKTSGFRRKSTLVRRVTVLVIILLIALMVAVMYRYHRYIPVLSGGPTSAPTSSPSFSGRNFFESLTEGECFRLEVSPQLSESGAFQRMDILSGERLSCDDPLSQYRFTGKETGAEEDDGGARAFDGTEYWRFDNGDRFGYAILARAGVFFVTSYDASTGHYRFWPLYLADDYALPPEVTNGGLIRIALDAGDSCRSGRDGDVRVIDGRQTCWTLTDRRPG